MLYLFNNGILMVLFNICYNIFYFKCIDFHIS